MLPASNGDKARLINYFAWSVPTFRRLMGTPAAAISSSGD